MFRRFLFAFVAPAAVLTCNVLTEPLWERAPGTPGSSVTFVDPWIPRLVWGVAVVLAIVLAVIFPHRPRRHWMPGRGACLIGLTVTLLACCYGMFQRWATWWIEDERNGPDGRRYALLTLRYAGGHDEALAVRATAGRFRTRWTAAYSVIVDGVYWYGAMIRPASATPQSLTFGSGGEISAVFNGMCAWVFDPRTRSGVDGEPVSKLSPFRLLGATSPGDEGDLAAIEARVRDPLRDPSSAGGLPTETSLLDALGSPNPWIRTAARRIVEAGGAEMYPEATRRLAPK